MRSWTRAGLLALVLFAAPASSLQAQDSQEECRVRVVNSFRGAIEVSRNRGATWRLLGRVIRPNLGYAEETSPTGFTAADWVSDGTVAASAVNAIHLKVGSGEAHAMLITLQPRELMGQDEAGVKSYFSHQASIFTDVPAGTGPFGPEDSPRVGNPVYLERSGELDPLPSGYLPRLRDVLVLVSLRPEVDLTELHVANREGGLLRARFSDGSRKVLARVERAVGAVGRFGGSAHVGVGRIRANHPGVIGVSTSPKGQIGAFQILPSRHARSPHLAYVWGNVPAWLIVGPLTDRPFLEGLAPLFSRHIRPGSGVCEVRFHQGPWQPVPVRVGKIADALEGVTEIRIRFPEQGD